MLKSTFTNLNTLHFVRPAALTASDAKLFHLLLLLNFCFIIYPHSWLHFQSCNSNFAQKTSYHEYFILPHLQKILSSFPSGQSQKRYLSTTASFHLLPRRDVSHFTFKMSSQSKLYFRCALTLLKAAGS